VLALAITSLLHQLSNALAVQVNINVECGFERDVLRGDDAYELRLRLISQNTEQYPFKDDD
jgi:hypothetical protein